MGDPNSVSVKRMALSAKLTGGLVFFSVLLMACVLAISIITLVRVYQIEKTQEADSKRAQNPLNIPSPATANPENPEKYKAYSNFASRLRNSMDLSKNPCDNFYEYSCGNFNGNMSFTEIQVNNLITVIHQFQKKSYMNDPKLPLPVKQAGELFEKCVEAKGNWAQEVGKGERLTEKMKKLEDLLGVHFPLLNPNSDQVHYPDARIFSAALAHLNNQENLPTFVTTTIETNWQEPHNAEQPYILAFDQATLSLQEAYYTRIWEQIKDHLLENMIQMLMSYAEFREVKLEKAKIEADAKAMLEMEYQIGANLNTREDIRRNYKRMYNVEKARQADGISKFLNFEELVKNSVPSGMGTARVENFLVKEPQAMTKIMEYIFTPDKVQPRTLFNYLFYRLLSANIEYLPKKPELTKLPEATNFRLGLPRRPRRIPMPAFNPPTDLDLKRMLSPELMDMGMCALENAQLLPWANGRVFLDAKFPGQEERQKLRKDIRLMIAAVLDAFRSMLSQLEWMSGMTKTAAYSKIDNLVTNAAWPDLVDNDEKLAKYYGELQWKEGMSYTQMVDLLQNYQQHIFFKELFTAKNTDRSDFSMSPSIVNAWYQPELNSITFPLGILEPPFYDPNFPASVNFGGIGLIAGHELTHGFDDQGIQWDGTGVLKSWMDPNSEKGFDNMAQCVVDEYGRFEPVKGLTIDGKMTQGENIADNGGLRASFKAYRTHVGLNGPDPRLPDEQLKMFSHDQLFFLSFAQGWCQREGERDLKKQLLIDPHSPSKYRVLGSIQNFPAFRDAFNCPTGTVYGPVKHCEVWETESKMTN